MVMPKRCWDSRSADGARRSDTIGPVTPLTTRSFSKDPHKEHAEQRMIGGGKGLKKCRQPSHLGRPTDMCLSGCCAMDQIYLE